MKSYTLRLDDERARLLKHISIEENRTIREVLLLLIDEYISAHKETIEILSDKRWVASIKKGEDDIRKGNVVSHRKLKKLLDMED